MAAVLCANVLASELLVQRTFCRHLGTALLVIVVTAVTANLGVIPTGGSVVYDGVFDVAAPMAIFWLLLRVNLRSILQAGAPMLVMFLVGSVGTTLGVIVGMRVIGGPAAIGESYAALGGMFVGTYTGGSVNFNALALNYGVVENGTLYAGAMAVDSIMTTVWMVATIALPRLVERVWPRPVMGAAGSMVHADGDAALAHDTETVGPVELSLLCAAGFAVLELSNWLSGLAKAAGYTIHPMLIITTLALIIAQVPGIGRLRGTRLLGMFAIYVFLAVIGAYCDLAALGELRALGLTLMAFVLCVVVVHGLVSFGVGALLRCDVDVVAVASQANIGGGTTALALARSLERNDLVLPAILVGSVGTAIGTYLGLVTAEWLL